MASKKPTLTQTKLRRKTFLPDFDALKAELVGDASAPDSTPALQYMPIDKLKRGYYQTRSIIADEQLEELTASIKQLGIIEPLVVRIDDDSDQYEILAGERRWRAAQQAGLTEVPVIIREVNDKTAAAITLVENLQREDLNPIEEAEALKRLMDEFGLNQQQAGILVGKSKSAISRSIGLLDLSASVKDFITHGELEAGHGKVLLGLQPQLQADLASKAVVQSWSVRELEKQKAQAIQASGQTPVGNDDTDNQELAMRLSERFAVSVSVTSNSKGAGKIVIRFPDRKTCQSILDQMGIESD